jgi:hypothetical protein
LTAKKGKKPAQKKRARPSRRQERKPAWREIFLRVYAQRANVGASCRTAGISRTLAYETRKAEPDFAKQWQIARAEAVERLEEEAWRRAHDGVKKPVYQQGNLVGHIQEYSDTMLIFLLKANKPKKYRDNFKHEHAGTLDVNIPQLDEALNRIYGNPDPAGESATDNAPDTGNAA